MIVAKKAVPAKDLKELIAWLKANSDKASQGTNGPGSVMHLAGVFFQRETGARFQFVPYRGAGAVMQDLLAGNIDMYIGLPADILPQARAGSIKVYAVAARGSLGGSASYSDGGRGRLTGTSRFRLVRPVGAERHAPRM